MPKPPGEEWAKVFYRTRTITIDTLHLNNRLRTWNVTPETSAKEEPIKADSLDLVELVMAVEDKYGLTIPDEDSNKLACAGDIANYVCEKTGIDERWEPGMAVPVLAEEVALREAYEADQAAKAVEAEAAALAASQAAETANAEADEATKTDESPAAAPQAAAA